MALQFGRLIHDYRWGLILGWVAVVVALKLTCPAWDQVAMDGDLEYLPDHTTTARAARLSAQAFPEDRSKSQLVLVFARDETELSPNDRQFVLNIGKALEALPGLGIVDVWTELTPVVGSQLPSKDGRAARLVVRLASEFMATENIRVLQEVEQLIERERKAAPGIRIGITGSAAIGGDMLTAAARSVSNTHYTTIALVTLALLAIYRSPWLVVVPLMTIGIAASASLDLLALLADWSQNHPDVWPSIRVFTTTKIFVIVLLFGAGTDYCLFLTARFREQLTAGFGRREAVASALSHVGVALVASALTTIVGLAMMGFAQFGKFTYSGPAIAICLAVTLLACVTLVPALLSTGLGTAAKPRDLSSVSAAQSFWQKLADRVLAHPGRILLVCLTIATPLAVYGYNVDVTYDLLGELSNRSVSRQGTALLRRHYSGGEIGPMIVFAKSKQAELDSTDGQFRIAELAKPLDDMPEIAQVKSLYRPTGEKGSVVSFEGWQMLAAPGSPLTKAAFVSQTGPLAGSVTRLFLTLHEDPFSKESMQVCDKVETVLQPLSADPNSPWYQAEFEISGTTAGLRDLRRITIADRKLIQILVTAAVFGVIVVLLRRPLVCVYLIFTVLLSYFVTMGLSGFVFEAIRGEAYVGLDWKVPLFLFVILVAVGQDYNIYLVSRVIEEQNIAGIRDGLRRAIVQTGGIITSCGIIMAGTFVSMTTAELNGMVELGFALSLGILMDTFLVRTVLVPAFLALQIKE